MMCNHMCGTRLALSMWCKQGAQTHLESNPPICTMYMYVCVYVCVCVCVYAGTVVTRLNGDISDVLVRPRLDSSQLLAVDPAGRLMALQAYDGKVKVGAVVNWLFWAIVWCSGLLCFVCCPFTLL
jgi:hypothetical protein